MKKTVMFMLLSLVVLAACKKEPEKTPEEVYSERLDGNWNVTKLDYSATITTPFGPLPITGSANNSGTISFNNAAKTANYNIAFLPALAGLPIQVDSVKLQGSGTFSNTTTNITLTESSGQVLVFNVVANEASLQILRTSVNYDLDSIVVPVTMELRLAR
jgi:hypothetical protein